jgi:Kdo2-lipid IVA lauroyltransferase/acyltransferase
MEVRLVVGMVWLMGRLPRHALLAFAKVLGAVAYAVDFKGRPVALENLRVALGQETSWLGRCGIALRCYQNFARTFCDLFWAQGLDEGSWTEHVEVDGLTAALRERIRGGGIWVTPHYGNFEMSALTMGWAGVPMSIVAQNFKNAGLTDLFAQLRQRSGHDVIPQDGAMIRLLKALKRRGNVAFLTDLNFRPSQATGAVRCFGLMTCVTVMHALLAQRTGLPIVPAVCVPLADGRYRFVILGVVEPVAGELPVGLAQRIWDGFEPLVRECPERWMWMYKHWRYLPAAGEGYPNYANWNSAFGKQVAVALA